MRNMSRWTALFVAAAMAWHVAACGGGGGGSGSISVVFSPLDGATAVNISSPVTALVSGYSASSTPDLVGSFTLKQAGSDTNECTSVTFAAVTSTSGVLTCEHAEMARGVQYTAQVAGVFDGRAESAQATFTTSDALVIVNAFSKTTVTPAAGFSPIDGGTVTLDIGFNMAVPAGADPTAVVATNGTSSEATCTMAADRMGMSCAVADVAGCRTAQEYEVTIGSAGVTSTVKFFNSLDDEFTLPASVPTDKTQSTASNCWDYSVAVVGNICMLMDDSASCSCDIGPGATNECLPGPHVGQACNPGICQNVQGIADDIGNGVSQGLLAIGFSPGYTLPNALLYTDGGQLGFKKVAVDGSFAVSLALAQNNFILGSGSFNLGNMGNFNFALAPEDSQGGLTFRDGQIAGLNAWVVSDSGANTALPTDGFASQIDMLAETDLYMCWTYISSGTPGDGAARVYIAQGANPTWVEVLPADLDCFGSCDKSLLVDGAPLTLGSDPSPFFRVVMNGAPAASAANWTPLLEYVRYRTSGLTGTSADCPEL